jgi:hypothetical protein
MLKDKIYNTCDVLRYVFLSLHSSLYFKKSVGGMDLKTQEVII